MLPIVNYTSKSGKSYEAPLFSCLPKDRQEFVKDSVNRTLQFKRRAFYCKNIEGNVTNCTLHEDTNVLIIRIKDSTNTKTIQCLAIYLDK